VPVVATQPAVAGIVERKYDVTDKIERPRPDSAKVKAPIVTETSAPAGRAKRASSHGIGESSASWYEEGERASAEAHDDDFDDSGDKRKQKARKVISPSATDTSFDTPASNRRGLVLFALLGVAVIGGGLAFALTRDSETKQPPLVQQPVVAAITSDAAPSQMIDTVVDAGVAMAPADAAQVAIVATSHPTIATSHPVVSNPPIQHPTQHPTTAGSHDHDRNGGPDFNFGVDDGSRRHNTPPAGTGSATPTPTSSGGSGSTGVSGTDGPLDPYNQGVTDPGDAAAPEKKAEFYASLGGQQLASSDTAGAAASFKKALELDAKNVAAVSGMGEIALRQGLFGDAIAHLKKAARLAPKNSNVYTLLGEAYLNSGQNSVAAENFKKALQLDPDNKRAREGYDDASSKVPPPTDE